MRVGVIGLGYVGLVHGAILAEIGHDVLLADVDREKIAKLRKGDIPIHEPGLADLLESGVKSDRIHYTHEVERAADFGEVLFICVGTPPNADGTTNLSHVISASQMIGAGMQSYKVVVVKSTIPVGGTAIVRDAITAAQKKPIPFDVVSNPEFLREGRAVEDAMYADRIIIGSTSRDATARLTKLYLPLETQTLSVDPKAAELIKYASNAFLATKISFINQLADLCERLGVDIEEVAIGMGMDKRIGPAFLKAGLGWGGSCFPKDISAFLALGKENYCDLDIIAAAQKVNDEVVPQFISKLADRMGSLQDKRIVVLGLSFKADTDDMRGSRAVEVIHQLLDRGADIIAHDPVSMPSAKRILPQGITYVKDMKSLFKNADAVIICTEWKEYAELDWHKMKDLMRSAILFDGRNLLDPYEMLAIGFDYYAIGRGIDMRND